MLNTMAPSKTRKDKDVRNMTFGSGCNTCYVYVWQSWKIRSNMTSFCFWQQVFFVNELYTVMSFACRTLPYTKQYLSGCLKCQRAGVIFSSHSLFQIYILGNKVAMLYFTPFSPLIFLRWSFSKQSGRVKQTLEMRHSAWGFCLLNIF